MAALAGFWTSGSFRPGLRNIAGRMRPARTLDQQGVTSSPAAEQKAAAGVLVEQAEANGLVLFPPLITTEAARRSFLYSQAAVRQVLPAPRLGVALRKRRKRVQVVLHPPSQEDFTLG